VHQDERCLTAAGSVFNLNLQVNLRIPEGVENEFRIEYCHLSRAGRHAGYRAAAERTVGREHTYKDLEARATEAREAGTRNLVLDLSGVSYMGSAGLRAIHTISKSFNAGETRATALSRVKLLTPSAEVLKVIKTLGFDSFLDIRDNIDDAVAAF
jgi:anti-anti-sigma factor